MCYVLFVPMQKIEKQMLLCVLYEHATKRMLFDRNLGNAQPNHCFVSGIDVEHSQTNAFVMVPMQMLREHMLLFCSYAVMPARGPPTVY